jgi:hypothetical protein
VPREFRSRPDSRCSSSNANPLSSLAPSRLRLLSSWAGRTFFERRHEGTGRMDCRFAGIKFVAALGWSRSRTGRTTAPLTPASNRRAQARRNRPVARQQRLKAFPGAAGAKVVAVELLDQRLLAAANAGGASNAAKVPTGAAKATVPALPAGGEAHPACSVAWITGPNRSVPSSRHPEAARGQPERGRTLGAKGGPATSPHLPRSRPAGAPPPSGTVPAAARLPPRNRPAPKGRGRVRAAQPHGARDGFGRRAGLAGVPEVEFGPGTRFESGLRRRAHGAVGGRAE